MPTDKTQARMRVRELGQRMLPGGDFSGFFDTVYATANRDTNGIPWADLQPHPLALAWLRSHSISGIGQRALVVGCGLGDDAEELARRGFHVTAFDVSSNAIAWCRERFPTSSVDYQTADLFAAPAQWQQAFDFVLEIYTVQALPLSMRAQALASIGNFVAPGGRLLVVCRGREPEEDPGTMPWPLTHADLAGLENVGLHKISLEDVVEEGQRHFRAVYGR